LAHGRLSPRIFRIVLQIQFPESPKKKLLKTLLVDNDRAMLQHCVAKIGGRQPLTVATSKAVAMHLLQHGHQFEVVVACERLADGSGLALLDDIQAKWPNLIRVFCTERQRLAMVRNRLAAFRLRYTLSYPVKPVKLEMMLVHLAHAKTASTARMRALLG
jgi:DNA-binding NtrC family response regulator